MEETGWGITCTLWVPADQRLPVFLTQERESWAGVVPSPSPETLTAGVRQGPSSPAKASLRPGIPGPAWAKGRGHEGGDVPCGFCFQTRGAWGAFLLTRL